jgi:flavorubredoxin
MAKAVAEGASTAKAEVELHKVGTRFPMSLLNEAGALVIGSPTKYGNVTHEMKAFLESMTELKAPKKLRLKGLIGGVFGSYTYDGGWVVDALALRMKKLGIRLIPPSYVPLTTRAAWGSISANSRYSNVATWAIQLLQSS